jgi:hypothetical protein
MGVTVAIRDKAGISQESDLPSFQKCKKHFPK